MQMLCLPPKAI